MTSVYLINRTPSSVLYGLSPYEKLFSCKPDLSRLKVFGCSCFVLLDDNERTKLSPKSIVCVFLGYGIEQRGYRCYDPKSNQLRVSRIVTFLEHILFYTLPISSPERPPFIRLTRFLIYFHQILPLCNHLQLHHLCRLHHLDYRSIIVILRSYLLNRRLIHLLPLRVILLHEGISFVTEFL